MPKKSPHAVRNKIKKNHDNWLESKKIIHTKKMSNMCPKNSKFLV